MTTTPTLQHLTRPFDDTHIPVVVTQPFGHLAPGVEPLCWFYGAGLYGFHPAPGATEAATHLGVDYALGCGAPLLASAAGTVHSAGWDTTGFGNLTILEHGGGLLTFYAHQSAILVGAGQKVAARQHIGNVGTTGNSTGCHVHWATAMSDGQGYYLFFNPQPYLDDKPPVPVTHTPAEFAAASWIATLSKMVANVKVADCPKRKAEVQAWVKAHL